MEQDTARPETSQEAEAATELLQLQSRHANGANWFFWIAALSLINSVIVHAGGEWSFVVGLGITQFIDAVAAVVAVEAGAEAGVFATGFAFAADLVVAGAFVLFGVLARKRHGWAFVLGMVLYGLDGLLFLLVGDWLSIAFHVFALFGLGSGLAAAHKITAMSAPQEPTPAYEPVTP
jgi:hypothetical protein